MPAFDHQSCYGVESCCRHPKVNLGFLLLFPNMNVATHRSFRRLIRIGKRKLCPVKIIGFALPLLQQH